jgi:hypothetical protein
MEINYELIVKYLCKSKSENTKVVENKQSTACESKFITDKSVTNYNFPEKFKNVFNDESFYRYGVTTFNNNTNISFWSSLLTLINKDFMIPYNNDENQMITEFKTKLLEQYKVSLLSSFVKKTDKIELREKLKIQPDYIILQYIVDVLDINFIVLDFKTEEYYMVYRNDIMNPLKQTFLFANYENNWEPIMLGTKKIFDYNDMILKQIINQYGLALPKYYDFVNTKKEFMYINVVKSDTNEIDSDSVHTDSESETYEPPKDLNKTKLNKMKLAEVQDIYTKLKLNNSKIKPTKPIMIETILASLETILATQQTILATQQTILATQQTIKV